MLDIAKGVAHGKRHESPRSTARSSNAMWTSAKTTWASSGVVADVIGADPRSRCRNGRGRQVERSA
jgi:hypothetical protein